MTSLWWYISMASRWDSWAMSQGVMRGELHSTIRFTENQPGVSSSPGTWEWSQHHEDCQHHGDSQHHEGQSTLWGQSDFIIIQLS